MDQQRFVAVPIAGTFACDIYDFPFSDFTPEEVWAVRQVWLDHPALRFRNVDIDDPIQIHFSSMLGPFVIHPRQLQQGQHKSRGQILVISNMKNDDGTPAGDLGDGEVDWHTDTWFQERPPSASILRAVRLPPSGGNTHFSNMYRAYEALPTALKSAVAGRSIHHQTVIDGRGEVRLGMTRPDHDDYATWPGVDHPIVRAHGETGHKALYLGGSRRYQTIVGLPKDESAEILTALWNHIDDLEFVWTQEWDDGDMVMWDNRCLMHRRDGFSANALRLMHRTAVQGERPH